MTWLASQLALLIESKIIDPSMVHTGDVIIALPSSGVHSNGFSLIRKIFSITTSSLSQHYDDLGMSLGEALLAPTCIYVKPILSLLSQVSVHGISHITGGGFYENIPRSIPSGLMAKIERSACRISPLFALIQKPRADFRTRYV